MSAAETNIQKEFVPRHTDSPQMSASAQSKHLFNDISKINEDESFNAAGNFDTSLMTSDQIKRKES